ncbi:DUF2279 domain-containing protein [Candidatus Halobeggiatoa sp. HSG11]|nr:DUF2279 domain-containing protein [Candidatus Halobeggiatoa sp. HSG11]
MSVSTYANAEIISPISKYNSKNNDLKSTRTNLLISSVALGTALYGATAWWDDSSTTFKVRHEGWFDADTPNGGADKLGHGYSFYVSTRLLKKGFEWAGHGSKQAAKLAGLTSATLSVGVEIMDGLTDEYGFSTEDVIMNLSGIGMGVFLESYPQWDELFDFRLKYWPSDDAKELKEYDPLADYSGQTYLFVVKASGIPFLRQNIFSRYLELAVGYGTRGYQPTDGTGMQETSRHLYYGISINLSLLLNDTVFKNKRNVYRSTTENMLEYLQMPGTSLLLDHKL